MITTTERRIALFLDFENLVTNTGITSSNFDLQTPLDRLLEKGKVVFRRAYCDWSRFQEAKSGLHSFGVELVDVPPSTAAGKNGADMRLVIDALELCYAREHIDTYVIASGDSDFCPLAYKLRENGRMVIGLAVKGSSSPLFVKACDEFLYLKTSGRGPEARNPDEGRGRRDAPRRSSRGGGPKREAPAAEQKLARGTVPEWVRETVKNLVARSDGPLNPSIIKETLVRREPDFDERELGFSTFSRLLGALEKEGLLKLQQLKGRQWYVLHPDAPESKGSAHEDEEEGGDDSASGGRRPGARSRGRTERPPVVREARPPDEGYEQEEARPAGAHEARGQGEEPRRGPSPGDERAQADDRQHADSDDHHDHHDHHDDHDEDDEGDDLDEVDEHDDLREEA